MGMMVFQQDFTYKKNSKRLNLLLGYSLPRTGLGGKSQVKSQTTVQPDHDPLELWGALGAHWEDTLSRFGAAGGCKLGLRWQSL